MERPPYSSRSTLLSENAPAKGRALEQAALLLQACGSVLTRAQPCGLAALQAVVRLDGRLGLHRAHADVGVGAVRVIQAWATPSPCRVWAPQDGIRLTMAMTREARPDWPHQQRIASINLQNSLVVDPSCCASRANRLLAVAGLASAARQTRRCSAALPVAAGPAGIRNVDRILVHIKMVLSASSCSLAGGTARSRDCDDGVRFSRSAWPSLGHGRAPEPPCF